MPSREREGHGLQGRLTNLEFPLLMTPIPIDASADLSLPSPPWFAIQRRPVTIKAAGYKASLYDQSLILDYVDVQRRNSLTSIVE